MTEQIKIQKDESSEVSENLDILLHTSELKHESALSNISAIDTKASILLAFLGVLLLPAFEIYMWPIQKEAYFLLKALPGVFAFAGLACCFLILMPQKHYVTPNLDFMEDLYNKKIPPDELRANLFSYYRDAATKNLDIAQKKLIKIKFAMIFLALSLGVTILLYILKGVIDG